MSSEYQGCLVGLNGEKMGLRKELVSTRCTFHKGWYVWKGSRIVIPTGHTQI